MVLVEFVLLVSILLFCLYKYGTKHNNFFDERGIPHKKPFPFLGSFPKVFLKKESFFEGFIKYYMSYKDEKIYGIFQGLDPMIVVKDTELLKQMTVKDFDHFINHRSFVEPEVDPLFGNSLFAMKDQKWKDMRSTLSPAFTGSKMRLMFQLISECCEDAVKVLAKKTKENPSGYNFNVKDYFTRYTNDVIASTAFGLKIDSISGDNSEFYEMGKKVTQFGTLQNLKFLLIINFKFLTKFFKISLFDNETSDYFVQLVMGTMKKRAIENIHRPDMINMLMEAQKSTEKTHNRKWTDEEIVAQCFLFFFAGFETTSILMCFAVQELMENPECQQKLYEEIQQVKQELDGKPLTYEALQGMKYLDMFVSETLRKWPPALLVDRVCNKPCTFKTGDFSFDVKVGDHLGIPIPGLHHDPENFPNPKKFDPERFSDENKGSIKPFSYAPFGLGPRVCVASRLALMESKAILFNIVSQFKIDVSEKSSIPLLLEPHPFQLKPKNGFWIKLLNRE